MTPANNKYIRFWYWGGAFLVFMILVIGGITRLTGSGLSMVDWKPVMGTIPPLTEADWLEKFEKYREFPEYQQRNRGMSLDEFKFIFFWEYLHRLAGRVLGLFFIIPFGWFLIKKKFSARQLRRALILLSLGAGQAFLGWFMVQSGLTDVPYVSPYRLASHLLLAFAIFGCCIWFALDLRNAKESEVGLQLPAFNLNGWLLAIAAVLILQIVWGAFVAGLHAGHVYNTFPKMNQYWIPPEAWLLEPFVRNLFENPAAVQWVHRVLGTTLAGLVLYIWARVFMSSGIKPVKWWSVALLAAVLMQYLVGIYTLLYHVPVFLGVLHQAFAMILFGIAIGFYHYVFRIEKKINYNESV
jgi:heme a synthase